MKIAKDMVVAIEYTIRDQEGDVVDSSDGRAPLVYLHGYRQIVPGVEAAIEGLEAGHALEIEVPPAGAYGDRDPGAVVVVPREAFPDGEDLAPGTMFRALRSDGRPLVFSVIEASREVVVVDANHPLAGKTLRVAVAVLSVRPATEEERAHHHVHPGDAAGPDLA